MKAKLLQSPGAKFLVFVSAALASLPAYTQKVACGPPAYSCSRTDTQVIPAEHPPQLGDNASYYGGHSGAGNVATDPAYGDRILRVTDGNMLNGESYNTSASAEKNPWSYDEQVFLAHNETQQLCLFEFNAATFQSTPHGCFNGLGQGGGADFGYIQADNRAFYNFVQGKLYRFIVNTTSWAASPDPTFNGGKGFFDLDSPTCLNGLIAAHGWTTHDHGLSSDDNTIVVAVGPMQDADPYLVAWNAGKGCEWLNVKTWQASKGWNTGMESPVNIAWVNGVRAPNPGGIHNAQVDRSGNFGIFDVHNAGIVQKMFWTLSTNSVNGSCLECTSHWACDYGVCFWDYQRMTAFDMRNQAIGSSTATPDMDNRAAIGEWNND